MKLRKDLTRLLILMFGVIGVLAFAMWISQNSMNQSNSIRFIITAIVSILGIIFFDRIGDGKIYGIDDNWVFDICVGIALAVVLIFLTSINIYGAIDLDKTSDIINNTFGAGIVETAFFFVIGIAWFTKIKIGKKHIPYFLAVILAGVVFAVFHIGKLFPNGIITSAGIQSNQGFFISAILVAFIWGYTMKWTKSAMPLIVSHLIFNIYALYPQIKIAFGI